MPNPTPLEHFECVMFATWLSVKGLKFSHIPNSTWTPSRRQQQKNVELGVSPGVPDYLILTWRGTLYVEMKRRKGGSTSPDQLEWIDAINKTPGSQAMVCLGFEEAKAFVERLLIRP